MIGEQIFRIAAGLYVSVLLARYLGPEGYGALNYAIAYSSLFAIVATVGLNRILVRELAKHENEAERCQQLVTTVFFVRLGAATFVYLLAIAIAVLTRQPHVLLIAIVSGMFLFSSADVIDLWYQARSASRKAVLARVAVLVAMTLTRTVLVYLDVGLTALATVILLEGALISLGLLAPYTGKKLLMQRSLFKMQLARRLLSESWPEIFAGLGALIFVRIDQIMLANMTDTATVGIYSVAVRLSESWYFLPVAIVASTFPTIVQLRERDPSRYMLGLEQLMRGLVGLSYAAIVVALIAGPSLILLLFGEEYVQAAAILTVHIWCGLFIALGLASGSWIMAEGRARLNLYRTALGAGTNVALNLVAIPMYGALGSAYATLLSVILAYFLFDFLTVAGRSIAPLKMRSLFFIRKTLPAESA